MKAPVKYIPDFVDNPDDVFLRLAAELPWVRHGVTPRKEVYMNDFPVPYTYGTAPYARTYMPDAYHEDVLAIRKKLEDELGCVLEVCFLNMYEDNKDSLFWHADNSPEMDDLRPIISVSLGAVRDIWFMPNEDVLKTVIDREFEKMLPTESKDSNIFKVFGADMTKTLVEKVSLGHGSACIMMPGMQDTHVHRIPKASYVCGPRISLTFRGYVKEEK